MASVSSTTTSANRLTGLATGLDIDSMVKTELKAYQTKIDTTIQQRDVTELRQKLYRDLLSDVREFNDKYLDPLSSDSLLMSKNYANVKFTSGDSSVVTAKAISGAEVDNYNVFVNKLAKNAAVTFDEDSVKNSQSISIKIKNTGNDDEDYLNISFEHVSSSAVMDEYVSVINDKLQSNNVSGIKAKYSQLAGGIVVETTETGAKNNVEEDNKINVKLTKNDGTTVDESATGQDAEVIIINSRGEGQTFHPKTNKLTVDGVQFTFNGISDITTNPDGSLHYEYTSITGEIDATNAKDKIVKFIDDYNTLIEKLNKAINTKHDKSYKPLTSDQKDAMSDKEVELWNKKVEEGQLYKDTDLTRITNALKESMKSVMSGDGLRGLSLEAIGIEPVKDYTGSKNGTFKINETKLTSALENDIEGVMKLFTANPRTTSSDDTSASKKGIIVQLKSILQDELSSDSSLAKKIGYEGTSTFSNNTLTKNISDYEKKISTMNKELARREQMLYSKYANLEKIMNQYNSQQSYLMSYLGN